MFRDKRDEEKANTFLRSIVATPSNSLPRLVFADWLDENGYTNAAHGQRWLANNGVHPHRLSGWGGPREMFNDKLHWQLPLAYYQNDEQRAGGHALSGNLYQRQPHGDAGKLLDNERDFLTASHKTPHDDAGNPIERIGQVEWPDK